MFKFKLTCFLTGCQPREEYSKYFILRIIIFSFSHDTTKDHGPPKINCDVDNQIQLVYFCL